MKKSSSSLNSWSIWNTEGGKVRVQINDPRLAKAFEKVKEVRRIGYSVMGAYTRIYSIKKTTAWVRDWMAQHSDPKPKRSLPKFQV